jgi:hypothetical protein
MSLEHSPARQKRTHAIGLGHNQGPPLEETAPQTETLADDLLLGAAAIAFFLYGKAGPKQVRDVYRNVFNVSLFKHGNTLAAFKSTLRTDLMAAQQKAREERAGKTAADKTRTVVKPHRRRSRQIDQSGIAAE